MPIQTIHTYLVHPAKGVTAPPPVGGTEVPLGGKMFSLLQGVYDDAERECDIDIVFNPSPSGKQTNPCRNLVIDYISNTNIDSGRALAKRLGSHTDRRSGIGLLFLINGVESSKHKLVISRFPTNRAILADENDGSLNVEFLERVFMKSQYSYKAVRYIDTISSSSHWTGRAVDRQNRTQSHDSSDYWISDFLCSSYKTTPAAGTKRLADLVKKAANNAPMDIKQEIIAAATLAPGLNGKSISIDSFIDQFNLSQGASNFIKSSMKNPTLSKDNFLFDKGEFLRIATFRSLELNNGAVLTAPSDKFSDIFHQEEVDGQKVRISTEGEIVDEKIRGNSRQY